MPGFFRQKKPCHTEADQIIEWHIKNSRELALSVITVPTLQYLLKRYHDTVNIGDVLLIFFQFTELLDVNEKMMFSDRGIILKMPYNMNVHYIIRLNVLLRETRMTLNFLKYRCSIRQNGSKNLFNEQD